MYKIITVCSTAINTVLEADPYFYSLSFLPCAALFFLLLNVPWVFTNIQNVPLLWALQQLPYQLMILH